MFKTYRYYLSINNKLNAWSKFQYNQQVTTDFIYPWSRKTDTWEDDVIVVFEDNDINPPNNYQKIYHLPGLTIYEKKSTANEKSLRFGISKALASQLLKYIRTTAVAKIKNLPKPKINEFIDEKYQSTLLENCTLDVAVWVDGKNRGSQISEGPLGEIIDITTLRTISDFRYKPLQENELNNCRFEFTLVHNLWLPINSETKESPEGVTVRLMLDDITQSTFMPMVANQYDYSDFNLLKQGLVKKSAIPINSSPLYFEAGMSQVFVETKNHLDCFELFGVLPQVDTGSDLLSFSAKDLAHHLKNTIDNNGFIPIVTKYDSSINLQLDRSRAGFALYSLIEYQTLSKDETNLPEIIRLENFLENLPPTNDKNDVMKLYLAFIDVYNPKLNLINHEFTSQNIDQFLKNDLIWTQWLRLEIGLHRNNPEAMLTIKDKVLTHYKLWETKKAHASPVVFCDLIQLLEWCDLKNEQQIFYNWLCDAQDSNGGFTKANVRYTRGISKIAEATAGATISQNMAEKTLNFLRSYYYDEDSMYFIPINQQPIFKGGFRFDYWNRDLWLDASSHSLLALSRLENFQNYRAHWQTCLQK